jgi:hypothetical protein
MVSNCSARHIARMRHFKHALARDLFRNNKHTRRTGPDEEGGPGSDGRG